MKEEEKPDDESPEEVSAEEPAEQQNEADQESADQDSDASEDEVDPTAAVTPAGVRGRGRRIVPLLVALLVGIAVGGVIFGGGAQESADDPHAEHAHADENTIWTCSMHPQVQSPEPGQCPICGMDLIPLETGNEPEPDQVRLSDRTRRLAEIRTSPVVRASDASVDLRLLGRLDFAESKQRTVTAWTAGRIDKLNINTTGQKVRRGQTIATIYSPEIYGAHQDLLTAKKQIATLSSGFARDSAEATLGSARQKLRLLGVPDNEISSMEDADAPWRNVRIRSPFSGTVIKRIVSEGNYIKAGSGLYEVASLGQLWVQLDAYESDLARLAVGQTVQLEVSAFPGEPFEGTVAFIDPVVNTKTRTARVRVQVDNADGRLRPGMFAEAVVAGEAKGTAPLVVPSSAPLFSGRRSIVYVERKSADEPLYEAVEVRLGPKMGNVFPVVAGLSEGEHVVTHGAFALDADLQIRGGTSLMMRGDDTTHTPFDEILPTPPSFTDALRPVMEHYLEIQEGLAADDLGRVTAAATKMHEAVGRFAPLEPVEPAMVWKVLRGEFLSSLTVMQKAATLEAARGPFERLTGTVTTVLHRFGNPLDDALRLAFCPMAFDNKGAEWVQRGDAIDNSYFGERMRSCGEVRSIVPGGSHYVRESELPAASGGAAAGGHQH